VVHVIAWQGAPFDAVTGEVTAAARRWRLERLLCDSTGLGQPLVAGLRRTLGAVVEPFAFSHGSKSELGFDLIAAASTGALKVPQADAFVPQALWDELRVCRSDATPNGTISWGAPPGAHDDHVVSLALCLRAARLARPPRLAKGRPRPE
jgi:hypothetical protein